MNHRSGSGFRLGRFVLSGRTRRLVALLLALMLLLQLTLQVAATDPSGAGDSSEPDPSASQGEQQPETPVVQTRSVTANASDEQPLSAGTSMNNTYMLELTTGSVRGGGVADCVKYFVIYYTTGTGDNAKRRSTVLFPGKDGLRKSMNIASSIANRDSRRSQVESIFGYTTAALEERKGMGNLHCDQILFSTPEKVETIDRIQIFGRVEEYKDEKGELHVKPTSWSCQTMHISRVDKIYGLEMYGWYSDDGYIDYEGEVIADVVMANGGGIFHWNTSANVFNIQGPGVPSGVGVTLVNTATAGSYSKPNFVGTRHESQVSNRVVFRMDLADMGDGGLECLAGSYEAGAYSKISDLKFCEVGALTVRYEDIYGGIRQVYLPMIINSLGWTMEKLASDGDKGDVAIAGFAQQGESIPMSVMLPDFKRIAWVQSEGDESNVVELAVGEAKAREAAHLITSPSANKGVHATRAKAADNDVLSYTCFAVYRDTSVHIEYDSATIHYGYEPGPSEPGLYITAGGVEGVPLDGGTVSKMPLNVYREGMKLLPKERRDIYLITISTDNVDNAGTLGDIRLQFKYINMRDKEVKTDDFVVKEYVSQFYGEWPGNKANFAYQYGLRPGGTVQLLVPLNGVKQFKTVSVKVDGKDEWQFKGIEIKGPVKSIGSRMVRWEEITQEITKELTLRSHVTISRDVVAPTKAVFSVGQVYDEKHPIIEPDKPEWKPGNLVQDDGKYHEFNGESQEVSSSEPFDWTDYRYYMTYEDTLQDLGFSRQRCSYQVTVKVAGNKVSGTDDDCGSANLFYFQLLFENGKSGCVLANQQLKADAFRTGAEAQFIIPTTQDYGDLAAIRVIPDDQDANGDIYDKLMIEYITVRKQSTGKISPTWTAASDSTDGLGWVGIDYRDPGAAGSNRGTTGRTISEISHTFEITKTSYSTKMLISITTGSYASDLKANSAGELFQVDDPILEGGMSMSYHYYDNQGRPRYVDSFDVIKCMNEYAGLSDVMERTVEGVRENVDYCVSRKDYQFRPGKMDNFYVDVDDIAQIVDMQLQIKSNVVTKWNITNVTVYLIQSPGARYINGNGEYDFKYPEGQEPLFICSWNRPQSLTKDIQIYKTPSEDSITGSSIAQININFTENDFPLGDEAWTARVTAEPLTKDDTLNLFIYPSTESAATSPKDYSLYSEVLYTDTLTHSPLRIATGQMNYTEDANNRPVFYALGLNANYFEGFSGVEVKTNSIRPVHVPISYGVLQRVRNGVLIDSYYLKGAGNADLGITLDTAPNPGGQSIQRFLLQVSDETVEQDVIEDERDLALAIYFTTDDVYGGELRTKYLYLSDQGYTTISPNQVLEVDFNIDNLKEITGVNLVTVGRMDASFEHAEILQQNASAAVTGKWSFRGSMTPSRTPARFSPSGVVSLLDVDLKTALSEGTVNSGTDGPIRMTVGYLDEGGNLMTTTFADLRDYIDVENAFQAGSEDKVRLLIPDMTELRWIELEPLHKGDSSVSAAWKLESLSAMVDLSGFEVTRMLNQLILETEPLRVSLAEILLSGIISIVLDVDDEGKVGGDYTIPTGGSLDLALNAGEGVLLIPRIQGSKEGVDITLNRYDPATGGLGFADLVDTRGYTQELLDAWAEAAEAKQFYEEAAVWRSITPDDGTWLVEETYDPLAERYDTDSVVFLPPHNYTGASISYRITITSRENAAATVYLNVTVPTETNPVDQQIAEARERDQQAIDDHEHTIQYVAAKAPTCSDEGNTAYYYCTGCGKYFSDPAGTNEIIYNDDIYQAPTGNHTYGPYVTNNDGTHSRICSTCGEQDTPVACTYGAWADNGNGTHSATCTICGYQITENCSYSDWTKNDDGTHSLSCTICGHLVTENCNYTCQSNGEDSHSHVCKICGYVWRTEPHNFGPPQHNGDGTQTKTCTDCGQKVTEEIPEPTDPTEQTEPTDAIPIETNRRKHGEFEA